MRQVVAHVRDVAAPRSDRLHVGDGLFAVEVRGMEAVAQAVDLTFFEPEAGGQA